MLDSPALLSNRESTAPLTSAEPDLGICPHRKRSKAASSSTIRNCCDSVSPNHKGSRIRRRDESSVTAMEPWARPCRTLAGE
jgi:hypothetical protein